jgi:RNA polymerase sigma-70 factor (ECF subfamily)
MGKWDFLSPYDAHVQAALATGDLTQAFEVLLQGYQAVVVQYCTALLDDAADGEDVAQEVFLAILRALPRYEPTALLRTWVFRIARNRCLKHRASRWAWARLWGTQRMAITATAVAEGLPSPEVLHQAQAEATQRQYHLHQLERSLRQLPKGDRALLMMYYYEVLSFRVMAQQLRLSEATVRRAVHAAEHRLRALMMGDETR